MQGLGFRVESLVEGLGFTLGVDKDATSRQVLPIVNGQNHVLIQTERIQTVLEPQTVTIRQLYVPS